MSKHSHSDSHSDSQASSLGRAAVEVLNQAFPEDATSNSPAASQHHSEFASFMSSTTQAAQQALVNSLFNAPSSSYQPQHQLEVFALVRFHNEVITLKQAINSLLPTIKQGVLITHRATNGLEDDGSLAVALDFVTKNPGFKLVIYPFPVYNANNPVYLEPCKIRRESYLDAYTTFGVECIKELAKSQGIDDPWIFKADADNIFDAQLLDQQLVAISQRENYAQEAHYFAKINVHYEPSNQALSYINTQLKPSHFLTKASHLQIGMYIERYTDEQGQPAVHAHEVYYHLDTKQTKLKFKQYVKAIKSYLSFKFIEPEKAKQFRHTNYFVENFATQDEVENTLGAYAQADKAQEYALAEARALKVNFTNYINCLHFKYLKFQMDVAPRQIPAGIEYGKFLTSEEFTQLAEVHGYLLQSQLFSNVNNLRLHCQSFDFARAQQHLQHVSRLHELEQFYQQQHQQQ